nr:hypothetical protein [Massilia sp. PDC64]
MEDFDPLDTYQQDAQREDEAKRRELSRKQEIADFKWLMADPRGRRIVWRQLAAAGVFQSSFDPTAMTMAFNEGRRSEGLRLLAQIHAQCPDLYVTMMKEQSQCQEKP